MDITAINQARAAIDEYNAGIRAGGEPHYPQWAADFLKSFDVQRKTLNDNTENAAPVELRPRTADQKQHYRDGVADGRMYALRELAASVPTVQAGAVAWMVTTISPPDVKPLTFMYDNEAQAIATQSHFTGSVIAPLYAAPSQPVAGKTYNDGIREAIDAIEEIDDGNAPEFRACQEAINALFRNSTTANAGKDAQP